MAKRSIEVFAVVQVRAIEEFLRGDFFAPFQFDAGNPQKSFPAARDVHLSAAGNDGARRFGHRPKLSGVNILLLCACTLIRHRSSKKLAGGAAKKRERAGPRSKAAHAVEDFAGGQRPVGATVLLFEQWCHRGFGMILRDWLNGTVA